MSYNLSALDVVKLFNVNKISPQHAWERAVKIQFPDSRSSREKGCPKNIFLAICEEGKIKNIPPGKYTISKLNKQYALKAIEILGIYHGKEITPSDLWHKVLEALNANNNKSHNSQMKIVLALWNTSLIKP